MPIRCPLNMEMYIGTEAAAVCKKTLAKKTGFECPKVRNRYIKITESCFHIDSLVRKDHGRKSVTLEEAHSVLFPDRIGPAGTGEPDRTDRIDSMIKTLGEPEP